MTDKQLIKEFADKLWQAGQEKTVVALANKLKIHPNTLDNWLTYKTFPNGYYIKYICETLNISADWLLGIKINKTK